MSDYTYQWTRHSGLGDRGSVIGARQQQHPCSTQEGRARRLYHPAATLEGSAFQCCAQVTLPPSPGNSTRAPRGNDRAASPGLHAERLGLHHPDSTLKGSGNSIWAPSCKARSLLWNSKGRIIGQAPDRHWLCCASFGRWRLFRLYKICAASEKCLCTDTGCCPSFRA